MSVKVVRGKDLSFYIGMQKGDRGYHLFEEWPFLEIRFSSNTNLSKIEDAWLIYPRSTFCRDWAEFNSPTKFDKPPGPKPESVAAVRVARADVAHAKYSTKAEYEEAVSAWEMKKPFVYELFLVARDDTSSYPAFDLLSQPDDICVGIMGWAESKDTSHRSNVMIIPKESIAAAAETERHTPPPPLWKGTAGSQK